MKHVIEVDMTESYMRNLVLDGPASIDNTLVKVSPGGAQAYPRNCDAEIVCQSESSPVMSYSVRIPSKKIYISGICNVRMMSVILKITVVVRVH